MKIEAVQLDDEIVEVRMRPEHLYVPTHRHAIVFEVAHETMLDSVLHDVASAHGRCAVYFGGQRSALISPASFHRRASFAMLEQARAA